MILILFFLLTLLGCQTPTPTHSAAPKTEPAKIKPVSETGLYPIDTQLGQEPQGVLAGEEDRSLKNFIRPVHW